MGSKQSGTTTSTQNTTPWGPQQDYLKDIFTNAQDLYQGTPPQYYPGTTTAQPNYWENRGLDMMAGPTQDAAWYPGAAAAANLDLARGSSIYGNPAMGLYGGFASDNIGQNNPEMGLLYALAGNNLGQGADYNSTLNSYANGEHLSQDNPYTDSLVKSITSRVLPGIQSQFIQGGSLSSPEAMRASTEGVGAAVAPELFKHYQQEEQNQMAASNAIANRFMQGGMFQGQMARGLADLGLQGRGLEQQAAGGMGQTYQSGVEDQLRALGLSPQMYQELFAPGQAAFGIGSTQQQLEQQQINDAVQRWNFGESQPWDMLNQYIGQVTGNYGGTTTLNQPFFTNPTQNILGTAAGAAGLIGKL